MRFVACAALAGCGFASAAGPRLELPAVGVSIPLLDGETAPGFPALEPVGQARFRLAPESGVGAAYFLRDGNDIAQLLVDQLPPVAVLHTGGLVGACPQLLATTSLSWKADPAAQPRSVGGATLTPGLPYDAPGGMRDSRIHWVGVALETSERCVGVSLTYDAKAEAQFRPRWAALLADIAPI